MAKGSIELIFAFVLFFVVVVTLIVLRAAWNDIDDSFDGIFVDEAEDAMDKMTTTFNIFDSILFLVVIGISLGAILSAFFINSHPIFFVAMFFTNIALVVVNTLLSNEFNTIVTDPAMSTAANSFGLTISLMSALPIISVVIGFIVAALFYSKGARQ